MYLCSGLVLPPVTPNSVGGRSVSLLGCHWPCTHPLIPSLIQTLPQPNRSIRSLDNEDDAQDTIFFLKGTIRDLSDKIKVLPVVVVLVVIAECSMHYICSGLSSWFIRAYARM